MERKEMKILLASDTDLFRPIESIVRRNIGEDISFIAVGIEKAEEAAQQERPDIVVLDAGLTGSTLQLQQQLKALDEDLQVLLLLDPGESDL